MQDSAILGYELMIEEGFEKKFDDLQYAFYSQGSPIQDGPLGHIITALVGSQDPTFADCVRLLEEKILEIEKINLRRFHIHMILNASPAMDFSPMILPAGGANVQIRHISDLSPELHNPAVIDEVRAIQERVGFHFLSDNRLVLTVSIDARNKFYAAKIAQQLKDVTLGLIDLANHHSSNPITIIGVPGPIDTKDAPLIFILDDEGEYHGAFYTDEKPKDSDCPIDVVFLTESMRKYSNAPPEVQETLRQGFSAYHRGIIEKDPAFAFTYFWACMEKILLKTKELDHHSMLIRFFRLLREPKLIHEIELNQLHELRNYVSHEAAYHLIGQYQRNLLKMYVDNAMKFFLFNISDLNKSQIELFYNNFGCHRNEFKRSRPSDEATVYARIKSIREPVPEEAPS
jgi:hypothetical protein